jgi:hypothetical protein
VSTSHLKFGCARMHVTLQPFFFFFIFYFIFIILNVLLLFRHPSPSVLIPALRTVGNIVTGDDLQTQVLTTRSISCCCFVMHNKLLCLSISVIFLWFYLLRTSCSFAFLFFVDKRNTVNSGYKVYELV